MSHPAQDIFNKTYITANEIAQANDVSRTSVYNARKRGALPGAICVGDSAAYIWERDTVKPFLDAWSVSLREGGKV